MLLESILRPDALAAGERRQFVELVNAAFSRHAWLFPDDRITEATFPLETAEKLLFVLRSGPDAISAMAAFDASPRVLHFGMAVVAPALQGQGIGAKLVSALEAHGRAERLEAVELETVVEIGNAAYYERLGYVVVSAEIRPAGTWGALQSFTLAQMRRAL
jgi:ribosomal protein S18 acetylase RimI-like enzyme